MHGAALASVNCMHPGERDGRSLRNASCRDAGPCKPRLVWFVRRANVEGRTSTMQRAALLLGHAQLRSSLVDGERRRKVRLRVLGDGYRS